MQEGQNDKELTDHMAGYVLIFNSKWNSIHLNVNKGKKIYPNVVHM